MVKVFRKNRSSQIKQQKTAKYLWYALGEIFLVVVGILVALQLNNLNDEAKTKKKEVAYLKAVEQEMAANLSEVESTKLNLEHMIERRLELLEFFLDTNAKIGEKDFSRLINEGFKVKSEITLTNGVITELVYSGGLKDISNDSVKAFIASWDAIVEPTRKQEVETEKRNQDMLDYLMLNGDFEPIVGGWLSQYMNVTRTKQENGNEALLTSKVFKNYLMFNLVVSQNLSNNKYAPLIRKIKSFLNMVERELDNLQN